jgi:hypothetical protein
MLPCDTKDNEEFLGSEKGDPSGETCSIDDVLVK